MISYYNLTQCEGDRVVYFRSTDVEQRNYHRLLWSIPDEWFFLLSRGEGIEVVDKSSNGTGKIERIFVPVLNDILRYYLFGYVPVNLRLIEHYLSAKNAIENDRSLKKRILFWKDKIKSINIIAKTIPVEKEMSVI